MSATARIANPTPSTAPANAVAVRAFSASCAVTAATPANTHPQPANAAPRAIAPVTGVPCAIPAAATTTPMIRAAPAAVITAATNCADRPTTPAINSSVRPASSSARVRLITVKMVINPITVAANTPIRHAVNPPTEVDPTGPSMARNAGFAVIDAANAARSVWSGYKAAIAENVDAATALTPTIHSDRGDPLPPQVQPDQHPQADQLTAFYRRRPLGPGRPATGWSSRSFRTPRSPGRHHDDPQRRPAGVIAVGGVRDLVAVMPQEQLLQGRR